MALLLNEARRSRVAAMPDVRTAVESTAVRLGGIDVLVNCVGIFDFYRGLAERDEERLDDAFDEIFHVNVKSQLVCVKAAQAELRPI